MTDVAETDSSLRRDESNNALINRNSNDYFRRLALKRATNSRQREFDELKAEVSELRELVKQLVASQKNVNLSK